MVEDRKEKLWEKGGWMLTPEEKQRSEDENDADSRVSRLEMPLENKNVTLHAGRLLRVWRNKGLPHRLLQCWILPVKEG